MFAKLITKYNTPSKLGLLLLIPLASLTSHTWSPIPPTMVLLLGAIACWLFLQMENVTHAHSNGAQPNSQFSIFNFQFSIILVFGIFVFYIFATQYFMEAPFRRYMGAMLAPLYLILILVFSEQVSGDFLKTLGRKFIRYSLIILCFETIIRYAYSINQIIQSPFGLTSFYQFKTGSPMYSDSNGVALHLVLLLFFTLWWSNTHKESLKKELFLMLGLIALTFYRASIPAVGVGLVYFWFFRDLNWRKSLIVLSSLVCVVILGVFALKQVILDDSFQSKFLILNESLAYLQSMDLKNILFGIGISGTDIIMTHSAHNYFLVFLMETGVFGLTLLCATLIALVKVTNGKAMIVLLPFLVQTLSASNLFIPYFYVIMALMIVCREANSR